MGDDMHNSELRSLRLKAKLTQKETAERLGISLRSYIQYETDKSKTDSLKYRYLLSLLEGMTQIDEDHGILSIENIKSVCGEVLPDYCVDYCYLFGSYAKGKATEKSDVDLLVSTEVTGLRFYELAERLRNELKKRIDLLDVKQLVNNEPLINEILKDGIRIYG